jgi:hypothetical protein
MKNAPDAFKDARKKGPVMKCTVHGEDIAMLLKHGDVRAAARDEMPHCVCRLSRVSIWR